MFEQAFKNIDDVLWKEAGCSSELDYTEQTAWLLFLKYLDGLEQDIADQAALEGRDCAYMVDEPHRWETRAAPKDALGKLECHNAMTGDDLRDFVNQDLFPYLYGHRQRASVPMASSIPWLWLHRSTQRDAGFREGAGLTPA